MQVDTVTTAPQEKIKIPKAKHWAGCTLNNPTAIHEATFITGVQPIADYYVYGHEVGASGTPHLQFMVCFKTQKALTALKKILPTAHWEVKSPKSTMVQASDYCKKGMFGLTLTSLSTASSHILDGKFVEYGVLPLDQSVAGRKVIMDHYEDTLVKAKEGRIDEIMPEHQIRYYGTVKKIEADNKKMPDDLLWEEGEQPNLWIWGPTSMLNRVKDKPYK